MFQVNRYNVSTVAPAEGLADCVQVQIHRIHTWYFMPGLHGVHGDLLLPLHPQSPRLLALITALSSLMLQVKRVADGERCGALILIIAIIDIIVIIANIVIIVINANIAIILIIANIANIFLISMPNLQERRGAAGTQGIGG